MADVSSIVEPKGRVISTANWLRSAVGIIDCGMNLNNTTPMTTDAKPMKRVVFGQAKTRSSNLLYSP